MSKQATKTVSVAVPALIVGTAKLEKAFESIKNRGTKLQQDIHVAALSVLDHAAQHGDHTLANRLIAAMPKSARTNALIKWMVHFGQLKAGATKADGLVKDHERKDYVWDVSAANAKPFWAFAAAETGEADFDAVAFFKRMQGQLQAAAAKADDAGKAKIKAALAALA